MKSGAHDLFCKSASVFAFLLFGIGSESFGTTYYIDAVNGSDGNAGTSTSLAWQSLGCAGDHKFKPGDSLLLNRGCQWMEGLTANNGGSPKLPFYIGAYGTGAAPVINDSTDENGYGIQLLGSWTVVESLLVKNGLNGGIFLTSHSDSSIVRNCEVTASGTGIEVQGRYDLVRGNYLHDLTMILNEPGNTADYGAVGVTVNSSCNEICYNRMIRCIAPSYEDGTDGGVVELYGTTDSCLIHNNLGIGCAGFVEVGGGSAIDTRMYYNILINNGTVMCIHLNDEFASVVQNLRMENNTILDTLTGGSPNYDLIDFIGTPTPATFFFRNNIVFIKNFQYVTEAKNAESGWSFTHTDNIYRLDSSIIKLGMTLDTSELLTNPLFVNYVDTNLELQPNSPAIRDGLPLGYTLDFFNNPVPATPSRGAVQYLATIKTTPVLGSPSPAAAGAFGFSVKQSVIAYSLQKSDLVQVSLFDMLGRSAMTFNRFQAAGFYSLDLKNSALAEGRYVVRFKAGNFETQAMMMVRR